MIRFDATGRGALDDTAAADDYRSKLADLDAPEDVVKAVAKEIDRLERTSSQSPEQSWIRTWLDTILELPWGKSSEETLDIDAARAVLDAAHTGLDDV
ncbi:MAG: endopeptidase La, partial [Planctomycetes bacterium]|nr:endopeptidase La [Planctomycetota bacterium]